jgi:hypothetical protein
LRRLGQGGTGRLGSLQVRRFRIRVLSQIHDHELG